MAASSSGIEKKKINYAWVVLCATADSAALDKWYKQDAGEVAGLQDDKLEVLL